ncbi:hypothetical protein FOMPIDRAFT_1116267, partial [Fomitopsis schrenkii]
MVRQGVRDRQVIIDFVNSAGKEASKAMNEAELVAKANLAVGLLRDEEDVVVPKEMTFASVQKLCYGGCLYEVESAEAARWLKIDANMRAFQRKFGLEVVVKARHYPVVLRNLPVSFDPSEAVSRQIEQENGWAARDIATIQWIKPPKRRREGQQTAFALVKFNSTKAANTAIMHGLIFCGQRIHAWRQAKEARRCLKCQKLEPGHMAADCTDVETCGTC